MSSIDFQAIVRREARSLPKVALGYVAALVFGTISVAAIDIYSQPDLWSQHQQNDLRNVPRQQLPEQPSDTLATPPVPVASGQDKPAREDEKTVQVRSVEAVLPDMTSVVKNLEGVTVRDGNGTIVGTVRAVQGTGASTVIILEPAKALRNLDRKQK